MIGIIIATHGNFGKELAASSAMIFGEISHVEYVSLTREGTAEEFTQSLEEARTKLSVMEGIIIFSDLFGGTPSNLTMKENTKGNIRTITGVNLPMLLTCLSERERLSLDELTEEVITQGKSGISNTSQLLERRRKEHERYCVE